MKKLIPALCMLLVVASMFATSTYAWFSMNTTVTVTGMEVKAKTGDNLQIAKCAVADTSKAADSAFKYGLVDTHTVTTLDPVSTVDGANFFYTSVKNVQANGDAATDAYVAYDVTNFRSNYGSEGNPVGYVDYAFQLKADNTTSAEEFVVLQTATLTYGATDAQKAFRIAIFVDDMGETGGTAASATQSSTNLKTILAPTGAHTFAYGTDSAEKAVSAVDALAAVTYGDAALIGTVPALKTNYYKVVVRLWLEGEDTTCNNSTFANLTDTWALDLDFELVKTTGGATVLTLASTTAKTDLTSAEATATTKTIDGKTYYLISGTQYCDSASLTASSIIYNIDANDVVTDITNQCTLPTA